MPQPNITWRREDGRPIFRDSHKTKPRPIESSVHRGEYLDLQVPAVHKSCTIYMYIPFPFCICRTYRESRWEHTCASPATKSHPLSANGLPSSLSVSLFHFYTNLPVNFEHCTLYTWQSFENQLKASPRSSADDVHPQPADRSSSGHPGEEYLTPLMLRQHDQLTMTTQSDVP